MAAGLGADVTILDRSLSRLRALDELFQGRVRTRFSSLETVEDEVPGSDVVIGAILLPGASAPKLVSRSILPAMKRGSVLVDVAIDQGGCFESSRPTTHDSPTYEIEGVMHYCVANMPGAVPVTSSIALNNATLPFGLALANKGLPAALEDPHLRAGLNVYRGRLTCRPAAESLGLRFLPFEELRAG
jgi:alanine dehydrogenase